MAQSRDRLIEAQTTNRAILLAVGALLFGAGIAVDRLLLTDSAPIAASIQPSFTYEQAIEGQKRQEIAACVAADMARTGATDGMMSRLRYNIGR